MSRQGSQASSKKPQKRTHGRTAAEEVLQNLCIILAASLPRICGCFKIPAKAAYILYNGRPPPLIGLGVGGNFFILVKTRKF